MPFRRKPDDWPSSEAWPLPPGETIVRIGETFPPTYILSSGRYVRGREQPSFSMDMDVERASTFLSDRRASRHYKEALDILSRRENLSAYVRGSGAKARFARHLRVFLQAAQRVRRRDLVRLVRHVLETLEAS